MPSFKAEVVHQLGRQDAIERLKGFLEKVRQRYQDQVSHIEGDWVGSQLSFSLTTYGFQISGTLEVEEANARLEGKLPFAAVAFRGKIEQSIASELEKALS